MNQFRSATLKLTIWYLAIAMVITICFSAIVYHFAARELANGLNTQTQRLYKDFPLFNNDPVFRQQGELQRGEAHILRSLFYFNLLVLVGAGAASYLLAKQTLKPLEEALEQQKRFTADVSHELRTPLTALKMESEVILADKNAGKTDLRATITSNLEEATKLEALIANLLRLSKLESTELQQSFEQVTMKDVITTAIREIAPKAAIRKITVNNDSTNAVVEGDMPSLVQLFVILLDNAVKYSAANSSISIRSKTENGHYHVDILDEGKGIEAEALKHVFDRFYRADTSRSKTETVGGYGLGLSIAKQIADLHMATITLTSKPSKGTIATVTFPLPNN